MATNYLTHDGDILDGICVSQYGSDNLSQNLQSVLDANPGLADRGAVYTAGMLITLPDITLTITSTSNSLWD